MSVEIDHSGKVALVTGSGAGIGREIARWMARAGASVAVNDIRAENANETVALIADEGGTAASFVADLRDDAAIDQLVADVVAWGGRLDIAVNNVGMMAGRSPTRFVDMDGAFWRDLVDQNLVLTALCARAEALVMMEQGSGIIINVSSGETTRPSPMMSSYAAAKAAINHLTWSMAVELGPHNIRVNAIAPGTTLTELVKEGVPRPATTTPSWPPPHCNGRPCPRSWAASPCIWPQTWPAAPPASSFWPTPGHSYLEPDPRTSDKTLARRFRDGSGST